jgi:hypothetical protein
VIDSQVGLGVAGYANGDLNYDGKINVDDYGILDSNIAIQGAPFPNASVSLPLTDLASSGSSGSSVSAVPEPSMIGAVMILGGIAVARRSRRSRRAPRTRRG